MVEAVMQANMIAALAAVERYPTLAAQVAPAIQALRVRLAAHLMHILPRPAELAELTRLLPRASGAVLTVSGPAGSGVTTLLCQLALHYPAVLWLPGDDAGSGIAALCAQLIALHDLPVALVPPIAGRDSRTVERLLAEVAVSYTADRPLLVVIDTIHSNLWHPTSPALPLVIPPGVVLVLGVIPGQSLPFRPLAQLDLPVGAAVPIDQLQALVLAEGCPVEYASLVASHADGSWLYGLLAVRMAAARLLRYAELPHGLPALYQAFWQALDPLARQVLGLYAVAAEPLQAAFVARLFELSLPDVEEALAQLQPVLEAHNDGWMVPHSATRNWLAEQATDPTMAHTAFVHALSNPQHDAQSSAYYQRQFARHVALSDMATRALYTPLIGQRSWVVAQERRTNGMRAAARDMAWMLYAAGRDGPTLHLVRMALLAGTLAMLARNLPPDAAAEALRITIEHGAARDMSLRRARALVDQLADGREKATALRRLGEVCYGLGMRNPAMRMLSEALDLETRGLPRSWADEREEALVSLARTAIQHGAPSVALAITTMILHAERRGMIDTEVVRYLLATGDQQRAEEVAYAIGHGGTHEWAMAEIAVARARAGAVQRAEEIIATLRTETAMAWAIGELASDAASTGDISVVERVLAIQREPLRDRALANLAAALATSDYDQALTVAAQITSADVRARALIAVAEQQPTHAEQALRAADQAVQHLPLEERAPVVTLLAAAYAIAGSLDRALQAAQTLPIGEELDRAQARIAVALARRGELLAAQNVTLGIPDDDERAWALDELARQLGTTSQWPEAFALAAQITTAEQRARTEADLAIGWARNGDALAAHTRAEQIGHPAERVRALCAIAAPLVQAGHARRLRPAIARTPAPELRSRYQAAAVSALAQASAISEAEVLAQQITRPLDQTRGLIALARVAALAGERSRAHVALANAFPYVTRLGRAETLTAITWAADTLVALGGPELLLSVAATLEEIDGWWV